MRNQTGRSGAWALLVLVWTAGLAAAADTAGPQRILILGDSMMRVPAYALDLEFTRRDGVQTRPFTSLGSGLARLDVVDWLERIRELTASFRPDTAVMFIGTNDRQPMRTQSGILRPEDERWEQEYARRVGAAMDLLAGEEEVRVFWLELPDMKIRDVQRDADFINAIFEREAARRDAVVFFRTRGLLSRTPGVFSPYLIGERGLPLSVRDADGVHLNRNGADLLARHLAEALWPEEQAASSP